MPILSDFISIFAAEIVPNNYLNVTNMDLSFIEIKTLLQSLVLQLNNLPVESDGKLCVFNDDGSYCDLPDNSFVDFDGWNRVEVYKKLLDEILKFKPLPF